MTFDPSSRVRLKPTTAHHFAGPTLFDRIARVICSTSALPRKELYESWEVARRTRRRFRGGRIVDLACGHGLVAFIMLLLDDSSLTADDVVVSSHACGALTDAVLDLAVAANARVAVLPCCHDEDTCDAGALDGWVDIALAIDATRARNLALRGYTVHTQLIPEAITPKNRLLLGERTASTG